MTTNEAVDDLAARYVEQLATPWLKRGLPLTALATAAVSWGLQVATAEASPEEVAEGLYRMADALAAQDAVGPTVGSA